MAGYIGGTVLSRLLAHPDAQSLDVTALLRSVDKAKKLEAFGVKSVVGSYEETALIEKLSEASHVVFTCVRHFYRLFFEEHIFIEVSDRVCRTIWTQSKPF